MTAAVRSKYKCKMPAVCKSEYIWEYKLFEDLNKDGKCQPLVDLKQLENASC
jgi:hypothetical protein